MITLCYLGSKPTFKHNVKVEELKKAYRRGRNLWVDFSTPTPEETKLLADVFIFHPLSIEDCFDDVHYPKIEQFDTYLFIILHTLEASHKRSPTTEVNFFLTKKCLVTVHQKPSRVLEVARERIASGGLTWVQTPDVLFQDLASHYVDEYFSVLDELDGEIDTIEDAVFASNKGSALDSRDLINRFLVAKNRIVTLRRLLTPQRDIFSRLSHGEFSQISSPGMSVYFRDIYDRLFRITELLDSFRDVLSSTLEAHLSVVSNRLNEIMKVLTIVTVILLPLTVITGIYGMNFRYMPELYSPLGYPWALMLMVTVALAMVWYFKHRRWL